MVVTDSKETKSGTQSMSQARLVGTIWVRALGTHRGTVRVGARTAPLDLMARTGLMAMVTGESPPEGQ